MRTPLKSAVVVCVLISTLWALGADRTPEPEKLSTLSIVDSKDGVVLFSSYYYLHPRPDLLIPVLDFMAKKQFFNSQNSIAFAFMVGQIYAANPDRHEAWLAEIRKKDEKEEYIFALGLWLARTPESKATLKEMYSGASTNLKSKLDELLTRDAPDVLQVKIASPSIVDMLWAGFIATGKEEYVKRVITVLPWSEEKSDAGRMLIGGAAKWSLTANSAQHPRVLAICESELQTAPENYKAILAEVVKRAKENREH